MLTLNDFFIGSLVLFLSLFPPFSFPDLLLLLDDNAFPSPAALSDMADCFRDKLGTVGCCFTEGSSGS